MASACRLIGARFIHISSDVVFDGVTDRAYVETDDVAPVHDYGRAKVEAETRVAGADPDALIVRTSLLWGDPADPGPQVEMTADTEVTFFSDEFRNPIEVTVLAAACLELLDRRDITGILHVAGADTVDRLEFAQRICSSIGVDPAAVRGGPGSVATARPSNIPLDSSKAQAILMTELRGLREATA